MRMPSNHNRWKVTIDIDNLDYFGRPTGLVVEDLAENKRYKYKPEEMALLNEVGGKVMCSCCSRQLKRVYLTNPNWRYCPKCGAERMRAL